jgi:hypothetical protein
MSLEKVTRKGAHENGESITLNPEVVRPTIEAVTKPSLIMKAYRAFQAYSTGIKSSRLCNVRRADDDLHHTFASWYMMNGWRGNISLEPAAQHENFWKILEPSRGNLNVFGYL